MEFFLDSPCVRPQRSLKKMPTEIAIDSKDDVMLVGASDGCGEYILWQRPTGSLERSEIHFEWNDQVNGGYHLVQECSVGRDGVHVVLLDDQLVHFYFSELDERDWNRFRAVSYTHLTLPTIYSV